MNLTIAFSGVQEKILQTAVDLGIAKTKSEAIRMALLELDRRYKLIEYLEDQEDIAEIERQDKLIKEGKIKLIPSSQIKKEFGWK